jgi:uncharacterized protein (DUF934 family)
MALITKRALAADTWQLLEALEVGEDGSLPPLPAGDIIVPLDAWLRASAQLSKHDGRIGVWLSGKDDPAALCAKFSNLVLIAVQFPKLADGRGYSIGTLLRERYGWRGELRAIGDVQRDQLLFLERCGFDTFALREGENVETALRAFDDFSERYQGAVDQPLPLFRRREPRAA